MLTPLILGSAMVAGNMMIQILALVILIRMIISKFDSTTYAVSFAMDVRIIGLVVIVLFAGHVLQFATWALLFMFLGEFQDFDTALYHSTVNFTSLGYGDIVMSAKWRLLGGLEAANGVLMFGLSAGSILSVMNRLFSRHLHQGQVIPGDSDR